MLLGGVIYLHDISRDRYFDTGKKHIITTLGQLCGEVSLDKVTMVTTKWGPQGDRDFRRKEEELQTVYWKDMIHPPNGQGGASVMRLDNAKGVGEGPSAWAVVTCILKGLDVRLGQQSVEEVLQIRDELVRKKKSIGAAKELRNQPEHGLSAAEGDEEAEEKNREKVEQLRAMHEATQQNRASLLTRMASRFKRSTRVKFF